MKDGFADRLMPLEQKGVEEPVRDSITRCEGPGSHMLKQLQVLIVDDDESIGRWLTAVLTAEGYQCKVARGVDEAEPLLREGAFQVALLDIYLGNANGLEFLEKLKALQPECNCVMMTAHASVETVARSVAGGALEYLSKPLLIDELLTLVRKVEARSGSSPTEVVG